MKLRTLLELGRTSNLPTVWSNVVCGAVLSGAPFGLKPFAVLFVAGSAFYEGGMLLNDAFDAEIDARERPERPIPSGRVSRVSVFRLGFLLLGLGIALLVLASRLAWFSGGFAAAGAGLSTAVCILIYNRWHKGYAWSPVAMGLCRAGLYLMAALALVPALDRAVLIAALALLLYIVGLTHIARFETGSLVDRTWPSLLVLSPLLLALPSALAAPLAFLPWTLCLAWTLRSLRIALRGGPGQIPRAVVSLIAGVSLVDATWILARGEIAWAVAALGAFGLTLRWQRRIRGT